MIEKIGISPTGPSELNEKVFYIAEQSNISPFEMRRQIADGLLERGHINEDEHAAVYAVLRAMEILFEIDWEIAWTGVEHELKWLQKRDEEDEGS